MSFQILERGMEIALLIPKYIGIAIHLFLASAFSISIFRAAIIQIIARNSQHGGNIIPTWWLSRSRCISIDLNNPQSLLNKLQFDNFLLPLKEGIHVHCISRSICRRRDIKPKLISIKLLPCLLLYCLGNLFIRLIASTTSK